MNSEIYAAAGPPAMKIPVSALTTTVSTAVHGTAPKSLAQERYLAK